VSQEQKDRVELQMPSGPVNPVTPPLDATRSETQAVQPAMAASTGEPEKQAMPASDAAGQQEQQPETPALSDGSSERPATKKRVRRRRTKLVNVEEILPRPSVWPLVLAVSIAITLFGIIAGPIVCGIGLVLVVVSIVCWALERR
jgi:Cytochrome c oxidase subunit IV.